MILSRQQRRAQERTEVKNNKKLSTAGIQQTSLEKYHQILGYVPALIECLEGDSGPQFDKMFFGECNATQHNFWNPNQWADVIVAGVGIRVRKGVTNVQGFRPAYQDTVSLTVLEEGIARGILIWNHLTNYIHQNGPQRFLFTIITEETAFKNYHALKNYAFEHCQDGNLFRFID